MLGQRWYTPTAPASKQLNTSSSTPLNHHTALKVHKILQGLHGQQPDSFWRRLPCRSAVTQANTASPELIALLCRMRSARRAAWCKRPSSGRTGAPPWACATAPTTSWTMTASPLPGRACQVPSPSMPLSGHWQPYPAASVYRLLCCQGAAGAATKACLAASCMCALGMHCRVSPAGQHRWPVRRVPPAAPT